MAQQIKKKFIKDDAVDGSKIKLLSGQSVRVIDGSGQEVELLKLGVDGEVMSKGQELAFKSNVDTLRSELEAAIESEETRAMGVESDLQDQIDQEISDRQSAISTEQAARIAGDESLAEDLQEEVTRAQNAEEVLDSKIDQEILDRSEAISSEQAARISGDENLQNQINNILSNVDPAALDSLTEVVSAFQNADSDLQSAITALGTSAASALAQEVSDRQAADLVLQSNIDTEESERIAADELLQSNIDAEETRAMGVESSLQSQITQEVSDRQAADLVLQGNIDSEESSREAADLVLQGNIDSEESRAMGVESDLQSQITSEVSRATSAEGVLQDNIDAEETRAMGVESSLQSQITQEISDRISGDSTLQSNIDSEEASRISADETLQSNIEAEEARAMGVESDLQSQITQEISDRQADVSAEESRAMAAESSLDARIIPVEDLLDFEKAVIFENNAAVVADGQPGVQDSSLRDGWYYENMASEQKINWYFFDGVNQANIQMQDFSAYAVVTFDSVASLPILAVYTIPTGSNDVMPGFAHSRYVYSNFSQTPVVGKKYLIHIGDAPAIHPELPRIKVNETTSQGEKLPTERVFTSSFGSNSAAQVGNVKMVVEHLGISSDNYKGNAELRIRPASFSSLETEKSERISGDSALNSRLLVLESDPVTKTYVDGEVSDLQSQINNVLSNIDPAALDSLTEVVSAFQSADSDLQAAIAALGTGSSSALAEEIANREAADLVLQGNIDAEESARISADSDLQSQIDAEESRAMGVESSLQSQITQEIADRIAAVSAEESRAMGVESSLQDQIDAEEVRAMGVESGLDSRLTTAEGDIDSLEGRMDTAEGDIVALEGRMDTAESDIDSLESRVTENESDISVLQSQVLNNESDISSLKTRMTTAENDIDSLETALTSEVSRATSAEEALDARVDVLEAKTFGKQKIVISSELSYIDLEREVVANSLVVCVNRLSVHKDEDYTVSVVGGKTRLTWINSFANPDGEEKIEEGDSIFVTFYY
jgi:hypothetical protein